MLCYFEDYGNQAYVKQGPPVADKTNAPGLG